MIKTKGRNNYKQTNKPTSTNKTCTQNPNLIFGCKQKLVEPYISEFRDMTSQNTETCLKSLNKTEI